MEINWSFLIEKATNIGLKVLVSLAVLFISFKLINKISRRLEKKLINSKFTDKTITKTLMYICKAALKILIVICIVGYLGLDTSGVSAIVTSLGVCVGLAVNGTLSNLAGGFIILVTRPFKVDDYIEADGYEGFVEDIRVITTKIRTLDEKSVYIPNGTLSTSCIVNYTEKGIRLCEIVVPIGYGEDFYKAQRIILNTCEKCPLVLKEPETIARMITYNTSSTDITVRAWMDPKNYLEARFWLLENIKKAFDDEGITIPFTQMDVHIKQ